MQIKVYTIEFKMPRWMKNTLIFVTLPALILLGIGAIARAVAQPFAPAEKLSSSKLNQWVVPTGAIMAFESACPAGWSAFNAGKGKFLVGSGGGFPVTGGSPTKTLTVSNLPSHNHQLPTNVWYGGEGGSHYDGGSVFGIRGEPGTPTASTGGGQPFDIMPPYVTVTFCTKSP